MISHAISQRRNEGLMLHLTRIGEELKIQKQHMTISLKGKVKGDSLERDNLFPCAKVTTKGLDVSFWSNFLIAGHKNMGQKLGLAITD